MKTTPHYYLGVAPNVLNPIQLDNEWFGVLWKQENNRFPVIVGYWFAKDKFELTQNAIMSGYAEWSEAWDHDVIMNMYRSIRKRQQEQDWERRSRLSIGTIFKSPWRQIPPGFYVVKSRNAFPLHASAVCKKTFFVWLEHTAVCESELDLQAFVRRVQQEHRIEKPVKKLSMH